MYCSHRACLPWQTVTTWRAPSVANGALDSKWRGPTSNLTCSTPTRTRPALCKLCLKRTNTTWTVSLYLLYLSCYSFIHSVCDVAGSWGVCVCVRRISGRRCLRSVGANWAARRQTRERTGRPGRTSPWPSPPADGTSRTGSCL